MDDTDRRIVEAIDLPPAARTRLAVDLGLTSPALHQRMVRLANDPQVASVYPGEVARLRARIRRARSLGRA